MFFVHQIVDILVDPVLVVLLDIALGLILVRKGWRKLGGDLALGVCSPHGRVSWVVSLAVIWNKKYVINQDNIKY
jgi:uncharacterized membrane protein YphA (DoxX/SURF4 family)